MGTGTRNQVRRMTAEQVEQLNQRIALARGWRPAPYRHRPKGEPMSGWTQPGSETPGGWLHLPSYTGDDGARTWELARELLQQGAVLDRQWLEGNLELNIAWAWHDLHVEIGAQ
jgi:hypothetical protein